MKGKAAHARTAGLTHDNSVSDTCWAGSRLVVAQISRKKQEKQKTGDFWWGDACMPAALPTVTLAAAAAVQDFLSCILRFCCLCHYNGRSALPISLVKGLQR
jgi:hypothetical protein